MSDSDSSDDMYTGPFTMKEMRKAALILRQKRTAGELQSFLSPSRAARQAAAGTDSSSSAQTIEIERIEIEAECRVISEIEDKITEVPVDTAIEVTEEIGEKLTDVSEIKTSELTEETNGEVTEISVDRASEISEDIVAGEKTEFLDYEIAEEMPVGKPDDMSMEQADGAGVREEETSDSDALVGDNETTEELGGTVSVKEIPKLLAEEAQEVLQETEQIMIQEFSLEESRFSGCNISALNLSFASDASSDPLATEAQKSEEQVAEHVHSDLYTLACISDLAEKINVVRIEEKPSTPASQATVLTNMYSPISPADSQFDDANDKSVVDSDKFASDEIIDAIVSLQSSMQSKPDSCGDITYVSAVNKSDSGEDNTFISAVTEQEHKDKDQSFLLEDSFCDEQVSDATAESSVARSNASLLNDTADEVDMILNMGVDYFLNQGYQNLSKQRDSLIEEKNVGTGKNLQLTESLSAYNGNMEGAVTTTEIHDISITKTHVDTPRPKISFSKCKGISGGPPALACEFEEMSENESFGSPSKNPRSFSTERLSAVKSIERQTCHSASKLNAGSSSASKSLSNVLSAKMSGKKLFQTPVGLKTPANDNKETSTLKSASVQDAAKDVVSFRVPKVNASTGFKPPVSRLPKPVYFNKKPNVPSPVSQYIHGPVIAPRITTVKPKSPFSQQSRKFLESKIIPPKQHFKPEVENTNPNVPAINLPYVDYDSGSSIKVVEHLESKLKPLPNKIKKLMPSPGSVLRHAGRVNIPECVDGRQEVSILVSHDAIL